MLTVLILLIQMAIVIFHLVSGLMMNLHALHKILKIYFFHHEHEDNVITSENKDATNFSCSSTEKHHALFLDVPATLAEKDQGKLGQSGDGCSIGLLDGSPSFDSANEMFNDMHINTSHSGDISPGISGDTSPPILEVIPPDCSTGINNAMSFASPETISAFGNIYSTYFYISF